MKRIFIAALFLSSFIFSAAAQDLDSQYNQLFSLEKQIANLQIQYDREKQSNDQRLMRIQQSKAKGNNQAAELELKDAYVAAERLGQLNGNINEKQRELDTLCSGWRKVYGPTVDGLLAEAEKNENSKKRAEIGARLQKYQSLNSRLCIQIPNAFSAEWRTLRIESYDGPQEIDQKIQLLKDISREMSIGVARLEEQFQQVARERLTRERAQEFVDEGTLFEGGVAVRTHPKGGVETTSNGPVFAGPDRKNLEAEDASTGVMSIGSSWSGSNAPATEADYKKQSAELMKQQEELRKKIKEFEEKERALLKP